MTDVLERKIIALFGLGNSYRDIRSHIAEIYGMSLSNGTLNTPTPGSSIASSTRSATR